MKIKLIPIRLTVPSWTTVKRFCEYLHTRNGESLDESRSRRLYLVVRDDLTCGLNLLIKDRKRFLSLQRKGSDAPDLTVQDIDDMVEFNYFFIRHDNGAGIYTNYRGSFTGVARLAALLRPRFQAMKADVSAQDAVKRKGHMSLAVIARKQKWETFIRNDVSEVRELHLAEVCVVGGKRGGFRADQLRAENHIVRFAAGLSPGALVPGLKRTVERLKPKRASVKVINEFDIQDSCEIMGYHSAGLPPLEYDDYVEGLNIAHFTRGRLMRAILDYKNEDLLTLPFPS